MQIDKFEKLEERIIQAMDLINLLKQENLEISSSYQKLNEEIGNFESVAKSSTTDAEKYRHELSSREMDFSRKKDEIRKRVEKLLERLAPLGELDEGNPMDEERQ